MQGFLANHVATQTGPYFEKSSSNFLEDLILVLVLSHLTMAQVDGKRVLESEKEKEAEREREREGTKGTRNVHECVCVWVGAWHV